MYNLNVNVSTAGTAVNNLLAVENAASTPRTPEILNSLIAMTNPLDEYNFNSNNGKNKSSCPQNVSNDSNSSSYSHEETSTSSPPSVQHTCSQLIKAGLKLSIESKRKLSETHDDLLDLDIGSKRIRKSECEDIDGDGSRSPNQGLTPEDEERRRRRRERNKIAATKCRLKKREKTVNLVHESEILETQNIDLKTQIQELESQRRRLVDMLSMHGPACVKQTNNRDHYNTNNGSYIVEESNYSDGSLPPVTSLATSVIETNQSYRPSSVDNTPYRSSPNIECFNTSASSVGIANDNSYNRPNMQYAKPPSIVLEEENYSPPHLTNLDNTSQVSYHYNSNQCHNYNSQTSSNQNYGSPNIDNGCMA